MNLSRTTVLLSTVSGYFAEADDKRMQKGMQGGVTRANEMCTHVPRPGFPLRRADGGFLFVG